METIYREQSGGRWEYWTYSDGQRIRISEATARKMERQGARIIHVK